MDRPLARLGTPLLVFLAAALLFGAGAGRRGLWPPDEPRYAAVARAMNDTGEWLVPHLDEKLYAEKPPVFFWLAAIGLRASEGADWGAKLPSILFGAATVALVFALGRRLAGTAAGLGAAVALATSFEFYYLAQRANIDATLTFATTLAIHAFARGYFEADAEAAAPAAPRRKHAWYALAFAACGVAVLIKGPAGFVVPAIVCGTVAFARDGPRALARPHLLFGAAVALAIVAAWVVPAILWARTLALAEGGEPWEYARTLLFEKAAGHGFVSTKVKRWTFYFETLPADAIPWTLFWPAFALAAARWRDERTRALALLGAAWTVPVFVVFSAIPAKRNVYLLPLFPGLALLAGVLVAALVARPERLRALAVRAPACAILALAALAGVAAIAGAAAFGHVEPHLAERMAAWDEIGPQVTARTRIEVALFGAAALAAGALGLRAAVRGCVRGTLAALGSAGVIAALGVNAIGLPLLDGHRCARPLAERVLALADAAGGARVAIVGTSDASWEYYLDRGRGQIDRLKRPAVPAFLAAPGPALLLVEEDDEPRPDLPPLGGTIVHRDDWRGRHYTVRADDEAAAALGRR